MLGSVSGGDGLVIDFTAGGESERYRRWGWSGTEPSHTWTLGRSSGLELPRPAMPGTYVIVFELTPFVSREHPAQRLLVIVNGRAAGYLTLRDSGAFECAVEWPVIAARPTLQIALQHPDAARPSEVSGVPDDREIALAFERLSLFRLCAIGDEPMPADIAYDEPVDDARRLMMRFESLGQNCEFGLVQQRCGADPLGLLRFASTPLPALLRGLRERFAELGAAGTIEVELSNGEYLIVDKRFGLLYHSWIKAGEAEPEEIRRREERRLPFLRQKLIEDLEEGRKLFVYHGMEPLARADAVRILAALRRYGPAQLLWVELADSDHRPGTVELVTPGLLKGYIDRFAPGENAHDLSLDCWVALCRKAYSLLCRDSPSPTPISPAATTSA